MGKGEFTGQAKLIGQAEQKGLIGTWRLMLAQDRIGWSTGIVRREITRSQISALAIGIAAPRTQDFETDVEKGLVAAAQSETAYLFIGFRRDGRRKTSLTIPVFSQNREWRELLNTLVREHRDAYKGTGTLNLAMQIVEGASSAHMPLVGLAIGFLLAALLLYLLAW